MAVQQTPQPTPQSSQPEVIAPDPYLGGVLAYHPSDRLKPLVIGALIGAPIALLLSLTAARVDAWWGMPVTVGGVALTALALGWYVLHIWNREVILYQRGFSFREGSNTVYFAYTEVKWIGLQARRLAYFGGLFRRDVYHIDVWTFAGDHIHISNLYRRVAELGTRLTEQVDHVLRPEIDRRLQIGEQFPFADTLALSRETLILNDQKLLWEDFGDYRIGDGKLTLFKKDGSPYGDIPLSSLYNATILIALLKAHRMPA